MTQATKSFQQKKEQLTRRWYVVDLAGRTLGRAATQIATILRGKHKATFTPHVDCGDFVIVVNADKVRLTGRKWSGKLYHHHTLFPGGVRTVTAEQLRARRPTDMVKLAVKGMLPKGPLGRQIVRKLKVYAAPEHPHQAQQPESLALK